MVISNHNSFPVLFDKIASVYFIWKINWYFSIGSGQTREPALCQLYRRTFVPYCMFHSRAYLKNCTSNCTKVLRIRIRPLRWGLRYVFPVSWVTTSCLYIMVSNSSGRQNKDAYSPWLNRDSRIWHRGVYTKWPTRWQHRTGAESAVYDCPALV